MSGFCDTISLYCCPPCPAAIAAKMAFYPPEPHYQLFTIGDQIYPNYFRRTPTESLLCSICKCMCCKSKAANNQTLITEARIVLNENANWQHGTAELNKLEAFLVRTRRGNRIACLYIRCTQTPKFTILFSHGNAVDIGQMSSFFYSLGSRLGCNILAYDYSGYGASTGRATEKNLYADIEAAWNALISKYSTTPSSIILYGQSIGSAPTVDLAARYQCAGVVLHSALMSGMRLAFNTNRSWCFDPFNNIDKVGKINSPVLVIHGLNDEMIDVYHGVSIHSRCRMPVEPLYVNGAGHNDVELFPEYFLRMNRFVDSDIRSRQQQFSYLNWSQIP